MTLLFIGYCQLTVPASDVWGCGKKAGLEKYIYNLLEKTF
jgi:hypothetical protein